MSIDAKIVVYPVLTLRPWNPVLVANGAALPMGTLFSYLKSHKNGILKTNFHFDRLVNRQQAQWHYYTNAAEQGQPAIWLFSSYVWNYKDNLELARKIKERSPHSLIIAGGPHTPAYEQENREFFQRHPYIDITVRGEGEVTLAEILEQIQRSGSRELHQDYSAVNGISFRFNGRVIRTADRVRTRDIDIFPSPYLTGEFDDESFNDLPIMILETNRGCPFGCTFCDWGSATLQKFSLFNLDRVKQEIEIIAKKRANSIYLGDSNFGAFERDIEIAKIIAAAKKKHGFPKDFGTSFAKNASPRLAEIIKILREAKMIRFGIISMQTADEKILQAINRANIRNEKHEKLIEIFKHENLTLSSELMIGLPGQTVTSHKDDLQFFVDRKLMTIAYSTAVMPNAPMNDPEYRKKYQIVTNDEGYVMSTSTFSNEERIAMSTLFLAFQFFYGISVLKYYLYYLQLEHSIRVMDFVDELLKAAEPANSNYPISHRIKRELLTQRREWSPSLEWNSGEADFLFNHLDDFYNEILRFTREHYGIELEPSVQQTLVAVQKAVMPEFGKVIPFSVELPHDYAAYFAQIQKITNLGHISVDFRPLRSYPKSIFKVTGLKHKQITELGLLKFDRFIGSGWELRSPLRLH